MLAERAGISRTTLRKIENSECGVTMDMYANDLFCLRLEKDLLVHTKADSLGRRLQDAELMHTKNTYPRGKING